MEHLKKTVFEIGSILGSVISSDYKIGVVVGLKIQGQGVQTIAGVLFAFY